MKGNYAADSLAIIGTLLIGGGAWMIYPPAALIAVGAIVLILGVWCAAVEAELKILFNTKPDQ